MILTCPSCGTQYVVKDGAIPPSGRQVRCKACQHSWREFPPAEEVPQEPLAETEPAETVEPQPSAEPIEEPREEFAAPDAPADEYAEDPLPEEGEQVSAYERDEPLAEEPSPSPIPPEADVVGLAEAAPSHRLEWVEEDEDFSPFAPREPEETRSRSGIILAAVAVLLVAATALIFVGGSNDKHVTAIIGRLFTAWPIQGHGHDCESHLSPHPTPRNVHRNQCPAARQFAATRITHRSCDE